MKKLSMKQISLIVSTTVFAILLVAVLIILNFTKKNTYVDVLKDKTDVGLLLNGVADDRSWSMAHAEALESISDELNLNIVCRENVAADESCVDVIRSLIEDGCVIIIATSFDFGQYMEQCAAEFPDIYFLHATGTAEGNNIGSFFGRMYQFRYLSGIIAGMQTKTNSIGYVASFPISEVNRGINAFTLGVRSVNPEAVVHVSFCGSWTDDEPAAASSEKLITEFGADVLAMHTDSLAPLEAADKHGIWSIGYNYDNSGLFPGSYLTGCVWDWSSYYKEQILLCLQGKFRGEHDWLGIESGVMKLVDLGATRNADPACVGPLNKARERFEKYSFDVFYGPVTDNEGNVRVPEGESLSDSNMLNNFDWYVEGVEVEQ
ncbi:MAG: BMP family ABC transporter substrate-binding protein [Ruminiclostridium sp.]|nr:BMP family ABC transporter substrate-binding protein [Ruminiclostridium sp.]